MEFFFNLISTFNKTLNHNMGTDLTLLSRNFESVFSNMTKHVLHNKNKQTEAKIPISISLVY